MQSLPFFGSSVPASPVAGFEFLAGNSGSTTLDGEPNASLPLDGGFAALLTAHSTSETATTTDEAVVTSDDLFVDDSDAEPTANPADTQTWCAALWPFLAVTPPAAPPTTRLDEIDFSATPAASPVPADDCEGEEFGARADAATDDEPATLPSRRPAAPVPNHATPTAREFATIDTDSRAFAPTLEETPPAVSLAFAEVDEVLTPITAPHATPTLSRDPSVRPEAEKSMGNRDRVDTSPAAFSAESATQPNVTPSLARSPAAREQTDLPVAAAGATAKFTDAPLPPSRMAFSTETPSERKILNAKEEELTTPPTALGTGIAKSEPITMSARRKTSQPSTAGRDTSIESLVGHAASMVARASDSAPLASSSTSSAEAPAPTARAVVQQIATAVEAAQTAGEKQPANVKLDFDFGDAQVRVRIEIRDEVVRAHFQTDSAELKHSLHTEWQATAAAEPARFSRLADPVFTSESSSPQPGANHAGGGHRESASRQPSEEPSLSFGGFSGRSSRAAAPVPALSASVPSNVHSSRQLHAFA